MRPSRSLPALVLLVLGSLLLGGCTLNPFASGRITVTAWFSDTAGLFVGNDVGVLGVPVGTITAIRPAGQRVEVTLSIDAAHPVPAGAAAVVIPRSVATDRYVELTPAWTHGPRLHDGSVIALDHTRTPVEFDEVLKSLRDLADGLTGTGHSRNAIRRLLDTSATALKGHGALLHRTIGSLAQASTGLDAQRGRATAALDSLDGLTGALATHQDTVEQFVRQVAAASRLLAAERGNFRTALQRVTRMIRVVARFARENRQQVRTTVGDTDAVMRSVLAERPAVREVLSVMPLAAQNLAAMLTPDGRLKVRLDITSLLPVLGPLLAQLCPQLPGDLCTQLGLDGGGIATTLGQLLGGHLPGIGGPGGAGGSDGTGGHGGGSGGSAGGGSGDLLGGVLGGVLGGLAGGTP